MRHDKNLLRKLIRSAGLADSPPGDAVIFRPKPLPYPFLPHYDGNFVKDTFRVSMAENGCYVRLLHYCWDYGSLPYDERRLVIICRAESDEDYAVLHKVLRQWFVKGEDGWHSLCLRESLARRAVLSAERAAAGRKGGRARKNWNDAEGHVARMRARLATVKQGPQGQ
jgi:uncharacterized protein YdaU (DUF1376 family)